MFKRIILTLIIALILTATNKLSFASDLNVNNNQNKCSTSCFKNDPRKSPQAPISLTGRAIMCVRNSLDIMFDEKNCPDQNILQGLKDNLKNAVFVALVLYIVLLGIKVTTSGEIPKKSEFFTAILKIGFVLYFIQGTGLQDIVYQGGRAVMSSLSNFLMAASCGSDDPAKCMCQYSEDIYDTGYKYLAMWDTIDCRIAQYLLINTAQGAVPMLASLMFGIFGIIIALIFSLQIILAVLFFLFGVFVISIAAHVLHFFILSMIGLALMTYFGVIFVPMILFSYTKKFFDNWVKATTSFALQPVIVTAFIAFPFLVFDQIMYEDCNFRHEGILWIIDSAGQSSLCKATLGYQLNQMFTPSFIKVVQGTFFSYVVVNKTNFVMLMTMILKVLFFCYLFMMLAKKGSSIASSITEGPQIGQFAIGAAEIWNKFKEKIAKKPGPNKDAAGKGEGKDKGGSKGGGVSAAGKTARGGGVSASGK
jgi:type IV secretion system protein VirB6